MLPRNKKLIQIANTLRKNMTKEEKHLWYDFLRNYRINFYRQRIIGNYVADFYCPKSKLVIELDGSQHFDEVKAEYDRLRTSYFNSLGIYVARFSNYDCDANFDAICTAIDTLVKERFGV